MTYRVRNIGLALALGLGAALLVTLYVKNSDSGAPTLGKKIASVFVASHDIGAGTPGQDVAGSIHSQAVPTGSVVPGAISDKTQVRGLIATQPILAGQQVTLRQFQRAVQEGIAGQISKNRRAYQLPGDANQLLVDTLRVGDHVDVLANVKYSLADFRGAAGSAAGNNGSTLVASRIVLRNLLVMRAPEPPAGTSKFGGGTSAYALLLRVTDNQAQKLFYVSHNSDWTLVLRPSQAAADSPNSVEGTGSLLSDGLKGPQFFELINGPGGPTP